MPWTFYRLEFQVLSQLHIGHQRIGNIQRTRHYVPARVFWGALTARLTRDRQACDTVKIVPGDYVAMGELIKEQIVFTYFFPSVEDKSPAYPVYQDSGLSYGDGALSLSREEFTWRYLGSYASTALNYDHNAADEGSLHEIEFISPQARDISSPVFLVGYIIVAEGCALPWKSALQDLQLGGERSYGWGRLRLSEHQQEWHGSARLFDQVQCDAETENRPNVLLEKGKALLAHASVSSVSRANVRGEVEPLVSRVWEQMKGAGQRIEFTDVCFVPGAKVNEALALEMTTRHIWEAS